MGLSARIALPGPGFARIGPDSAVHMCNKPKRILSPFLQSTDLIPAEETRDASRVLPLGMMSTLVLNGLTGWIMVITFCFCIGNVEDAVNSPTGQPYIQVFYNATNSHAGATVMSAIIVFMTLCAIITNLATVSRQTFAFARDFHDSRVARFLSHVSMILNHHNATFQIDEWKEIGQSPLQYSPQRSLPLLHTELSTLPHQYRQLSCLQRNRIPCHGDPPLLLYHLDILRHPQALAWGAFPE